MAQNRLIGKEIGKYKLTEYYGSGLGSAIYQAITLDDDNLVVLKLYPREFGQDDAFVSRFKQEVRMVKRLSHDAIVPPLDVDVDDRIPYVVMPFLPGGSLADVLAEYGPYPLAEALPIVERVTAALTYAHERNIIHGNVTPGNILFDGEGNAYLSDFSLPVTRERIGAMHNLPLGLSPAVMPPEVGHGQLQLDPAVDVYELAVVLYWMLTGQPPYAASGPVQQIMLHLNAPVPNLREAVPGAPPALTAILRRALAKDASQRYARPADLAAALAEVGADDAAPEPAQAAPPPADPPEPVTPAAPANLPPPGGREGVQPRAEGEGPRVTPMTAPDVKDRAHMYGKEGGRYPSRGASASYTGEQRRAIRQRKREQRRMERQARRQSGGLRWYVVLIALVVVGAAALGIGALGQAELQRRADEREMAALNATNTREALSLFRQQTSTAEALAAAVATETQSAIFAAGTATASVPTPTPTATVTPTPTPTRTPTPFAGSSSGMIAYVSERDGDPDIFVLDLDSEEETRITDNDVIDAQPAWSPEGQTLAFQSEGDIGRHIYTVDMACLDEPETCPEQVRQLTDGSRVDSYPVWSPTGGQVAFVSVEQGRHWLRAITLDGTERDLAQVLIGNRLLDWAPDGLTLTFFGPGAGGVFEIFQLQVGETNDDRIAITDAKGAVEDVDFLPNREEVVYAALLGQRRQLFLADADCEFMDDCVITRLTDDEFTYLTPDVSPDGTLILTATDRDGNLDLIVLDRDGETVQQLTDQPYDEYQGVWRPVP